MRTKLLGEWLMNAALFVATIIVFQAVGEAVAAANAAVAICLGIAVSALLLLAGLWVLGKAEEQEDAAKEKTAASGQGRTNALRAGTRRARAAKGARKGSTGKKSR